MPKECPSCHRESPIDSPYCPACGAPMNPDAYRIQTEKTIRSAVELPMKWHKFLTFFSLPLGFIVTIVNLIDVLRTLSAFDPSLFYPEYVDLVKFSLYLDAGMRVLLIPLFALAEIFLLKMKWRGVGLVLALYLIQGLYAAANGAMMLQIKESPLLPLLAAAEMTLMFCLTRVYYRKRKTMLL